MDKIYKVGVIGCGGISRMHANWYRDEPRTKIVAAADISEAQVNKFGDEYRVERLYTDFIEMLETEALDFVSVCTRPKLHAPVTIEVAKHGVKVILTEKPMAENLGQADAMIEACEQNGVKLAVDHQLRFDPPYVAAKHLLADGAIGELFRIHAICGGGDLKDNATHAVDLMRFLHNDRPIEWVTGQIERIGTPTKYDLESEDFAMGYFKFADNVRGIIESGHDTAPGYHHIYCYGTAGEIELAVPGGPGIRMRTKTSGGDWVIPETRSEKGPVQELIACVEEGREHRSSGYQGKATLEVLMAIYESSRRRQRIRLPMAEKESPLTLMIQEGLM